MEDLKATAEELDRQIDDAYDLGDWFVAAQLEGELARIEALLETEQGDERSRP